MLCLPGLFALSQAAPAPKPRLIILTDIGGDPDDEQSMVRLMTWSNAFDIEGLIASASGTPGELKRSVVRPDLIRNIVKAYGRVRPNLVMHDPGYPPVERLMGAVKAGDPDRSMQAIGAGHDTEGSRWIVSVVDRPDPRPVNVAIWGGGHDLAQALWRVRQDRSPAGLDRFVSKLRVHSIEHQDETGPWVVNNFPKLFFILSSSNPGRVLGGVVPRDRRLSVYRGMYLGGDEGLTSRQWIEDNVRNSHGPLGALYPPKTSTAPNPHGALKEGDTPSWFYFLLTGLNDPERPEWGGWGGRFQRVRDNYFNDAEDRAGEIREARATVWRWRGAFQNEFAARLDWCAMPDRRRANHKPVAVLNGDRTLRIIQLEARAGDRLLLSAAGSSDPDQNDLTFHWFHYPEPGSSERAIELGSSSNSELVFTAPAAVAPAEFHIVLEVKDRGAPPLSAFRRAVVRIAPLSGDVPTRDDDRERLGIIDDPVVGGDHEQRRVRFTRAEILPGQCGFPVRVRAL